MTTAALPPAPAEGPSRRSVLRGAAGAVLWTAPVVQVVTMTAADAASDSTRSNGEPVLTRQPTGTAPGLLLLVVERGAARYGYGVADGVLGSVPSPERARLRLAFPTIAFTGGGPAGTVSWAGSKPVVRATPSVHDDGTSLLNVLLVAIAPVVGSSLVRAESVTAVGGHAAPISTPDGLVFLG